jgi:hypothetical protein
MSNRIGRVTYEGRYVIVLVPDDWHTGDPLPEANLDDQWFDSLAAFVAALDAPYEHRPVNRRPLNPLPPATVPVPETPHS